jgi:hypothetical protein
MMSESEWLECSDPQAMLEFLKGKASDRKLRLFACACCRRIWHLLHDKRSQKSLECSEQYADGQIDKEQLAQAGKNAQEAWWPKYLRQRGRRQRERVPDEKRRFQCAAEAVTFVASATGRATEHFYRMRLAASGSLNAELLEQRSSSSQPRLYRCHFLRDIFGNPFRPITLDPAWLTLTVKALAQKIYDDRTFDQMPALADELEKAGCANQEILSHCRGPAPHVRGCWVVDIILGKE